MKEEPMPAFVAILAPKTDEEAQRAQRYVRELRIKTGIVNGERPTIHNEPATLVYRNAPLVTTYEEIV